MNPKPCRFALRCCQFGALLASFYLMAAHRAYAVDTIDLPPGRREASSSEGRYTLVLTSLDGWETYRVKAELYEGRPADRHSVWQRELPHNYGPRRALVSGQGEVLLADEWINVLSKYALTLIDRQNRMVAQYSAEQVIAALGVPIREVGSHAKAGPWITDGPSVSPDGRSALITAGGRVLAISLADGKLSVRQ